MGDTNTIQISSSLINRLTHEEKKPKRTKKVRPKTPPEQSPQPQDMLKPASNTEKSSSTIGKWPLQPPLFFPARPPPPLPAASELEVIKSVIRESDMVVEKLEKQEANMIQELTKRAKELHEKEFKLPYQKPAPCLSEREACLLCYKEHIKDPLNCASVVKKFADCARQVRQHHRL